MPRRPLKTPDAWTDPRHRLGFSGEEDAIGYLIAAGWEVEAHRFRVGRNDLDLVARKDGLVAFIEVKTRRGQEMGPGRLAIGWKKRQSLERVAEVWRIRHGRAGDCYRFDVIEVAPQGEEPSRIEHIEDAWRGRRPTV